jgi:abortive infection bacteriophage resistance protein
MDGTEKIRPGVTAFNCNRRNQSPLVIIFALYTESLTAWIHEIDQATGFCIHVKALYN